MTGRGAQDGAGSQVFLLSQGYSLQAGSPAAMQVFSEG
jgi:hypothetical protein